MNKNIKRLVLLAFAVPALSIYISGQAADVFDEGLKKALESYDKAWNSKDVKAVASMLDDNYVYFSSVGSLSTKKPTLEFLAKPDYKLTFVERSELVLHKYDDNVAVVSSRWKGKGSWSGGEINDDQRCGQVWTKQSGKWRMVSEHCVQIAKPQ